MNDETATDVEVNNKSTSSRAVGLLIRYHANVNAQDNDKLTPLAIACQRGNYSAVQQLLLSEDINVGIQDNQESTALHEACENGSKRIVELLLNNGATVSAADKDGVTPFHIACREGYGEIVNIILLRFYHIKNQLVSVEDIQGNRALHFAAESGVESIVKALLLAAADPIAQKNNEVTPLHIAARNGHINIAALLLQYKDQSNAHFNILETTEREQNTPLHFAARHNRCEMIRYLVEK